MLCGRRESGVLQTLQLARVFEVIERVVKCRHCVGVWDMDYRRCAGLGKWMGTDIDWVSGGVAKSIYVPYAREVKHQNRIGVNIAL